MNVLHHNIKRDICIWLVAGLVALCLSVGCGEDDPQPDQTINNIDDDAGPDADGSEDGGPTADADADADAQVDADGGGGEEIGRSCIAPPEDLGSFAVGDEREVVRGFYRLSQAHSTCRDADPDAGVFWFEFEVDTWAKATFEVVAAAATAPAIELRQHECASADEVVFCTESASRIEVLEPGVTYYMVVQGAQDSAAGDFRLDLSFEDVVCEPGPSVCETGVVEMCREGFEVLERDCAEGCADGATCNGDVCDTAVAVDLSTAGVTQIVEGNQQAYADEWSAEGLGGCSTVAGEPAGDTAGAEIFLELSGHSAGDTILLDADDGSVDFGFYIRSSCAATDCLDAGAYDDLGDNRFEWQADTSDPVYVAAEVFGPDRDRDFRIEVTRQP